MAEEQLVDPPKGQRGVAMNKLHAVRRRIKPWYIYALIATAIVTLAVVLSAVLVTRRNHQWFIEKVQHDKAVPAPYLLFCVFALSFLKSLPSLS